MADPLAPVTDPDDPHTSRMPPSRCPYCGIIQDAALRFEEVLAPKPDDLAVCGWCAQVVIYDADLRLRKPSPAELAAIYAEDPELAANTAKYRRAVLGVEVRSTQSPGST